MRVSTGYLHFFVVGLVGMGACMSKCKEQPKPVIEASAPVAEVPTTPPVDLVPEIIDAGPPDADAAKPGTGVYVNPNVARIRACCAAVNGQAKTLGMSPEAAMLMGVAAQCNAAASALQTNPNAPELAALKAALAGKNLPNVCSGL